MNASPSLQFSTGVITVEFVVKCSVEDVLPIPLPPLSIALDVATTKMSEFARATIVSRFMLIVLSRIILIGKLSL
jgi:hypothetical protein